METMSDFFPAQHAAHRGDLAGTAERRASIQLAFYLARYWGTRKHSRKRCDQLMRRAARCWNYS